MRNYRTFLPFIFLSLSFLVTTAQGANEFDEIAKKINLTFMMKDIESLSSAHFEGRQAGTVNGQQAANFVIKRLQHLGLVPAGKLEDEGTNRTWIQQRPLLATKLSDSATMNISVFSKLQEQFSVALKLGSDFLPILDSPSVNITAPIVFVGYGINDPARGVDDYKGIDAHNRIVMFLRGKPTTYSQWVTHEEKVQTAQKYGAAGFITVAGPILNRYEARRGIGGTPLAMYSSFADERPLAGVWINGDIGKKLFTLQGHSLKDIQAQLNKGKSRLLKELGILAHLQWDSTNTPGMLINVVGKIPGHDPALRQEIILIGAHRDHFGKQAGLLFPGADDNASGTAVLLEVARLIATSKPGPARTIVFVSFDGEERGTLGSKFYVQQPSHPLNKTVAMINVDHVGVGGGKLTVGLTRLPKAIGEQASNISHLTDKTKLYGYFPGGDHVPFYEAKVPTVTVVSSGKHTSFHQSSDTAETIQPEILKNAARYVLALTRVLVIHKNDVRSRNQYGWAPLHD